MADLKMPALILQGERYTLGKREEVEGYALSKSIHVDFLPDGDHDLKPRKVSGWTRAEKNWVVAVERMAAFIRGL